MLAYLFTERPGRERTESQHRTQEPPFTKDNSHAIPKWVLTTLKCLNKKDTNQPVSFNMMIFIIKKWSKTEGVSDKHYTSHRVSRLFC